MVRKSAFVGDGVNRYTVGSELKWKADNLISGKLQGSPRLGEVDELPESRFGVRVGGTPSIIHYKQS